MKGCAGGDSGKFSALLHFRDTAFLFFFSFPRGMSLSLLRFRSDFDVLA